MKILTKIDPIQTPSLSELAELTGKNKMAAPAVHPHHLKGKSFPSGQSKFHGPLCYGRYIA